MDLHYGFVYCHLRLLDGTWVAFSTNCLVFPQKKNLWSHATKTPWTRGVRQFSLPTWLWVRWSYRYGDITTEVQQLQTKLLQGGLLRTDRYKWSVMGPLYINGRKEMRNWGYNTEVWKMMAKEDDPASSIGNGQLLNFGEGDWPW